MIKVSSDYRRLEPDEVAQVAAECATAWQDLAIPMRQWVGVVRAEIQRYREGEAQPHFDVLIRALKRIAARAYRPLPSLLDVGASSGFYSEILKLGGVTVDYTGLDYSEEYARLARELFPGIQFQVGDATALPFANDSFDIVLSGCVLLHCFEYEKVIAESARVARQYVAMNRTPVLMGQETSFFEKTGYGTRMFEVHINEAELLRLFAKHGLTVVSEENVFVDQERQYAHRTYLLHKGWD